SAVRRASCLSGTETAAMNPTIRRSAKFGSASAGETGHNRHTSTRSHMKNRLAIAAVAALTAVSLTACNDSDSKGADEKSSASPSPSESTPTEESTPVEEPSSAAPGESSEDTPAGAELKIGDSAVVTSSYAKKEITVKLTVTEIVE